MRRVIHLLSSYKEKNFRALPLSWRTMARAPNRLLSRFLPNVLFPFHLIKKNTIKISQFPRKQSFKKLQIIYYRRYVQYTACTLHSTLTFLPGSSCYCSAEHWHAIKATQGLASWSQPWNLFLIFQKIVLFLTSLTPLSLPLDPSFLTFDTNIPANSNLDSKIKQRGPDGFRFMNKCKKKSRDTVPCKA